MIENPEMVGVFCLSELDYTSDCSYSGLEVFAVVGPVDFPPDSSLERVSRPRMKVTLG